MYTFVGNPEPPYLWIALAVVNIVFTLMVCKILHCEIKKRKHENIKFTTWQFKLWSIVCISSCFTGLFLSVFEKINIVCTFASFVIAISYVVMFLSMGFYQLSRLHYCFANSQIHSDKGYPKWLFNIMYIFAILMVINLIVVLEIGGDGDIVWHTFNSKCGINDKLQFYYQPIDIISSNVTLFPYAHVSILCFFFWDLFTLSLYIFKIRSFRIYKDKNPSVYKRIKSILQKIFILTMLYQLTALIYVVMVFFGFIGLKVIETIVSIMALFLTGIFPLIFSLSMYLMMDHNVKQYIRFLKIVQFLKLNYLCCKWSYFVLEQLEDLDGNVQIVVTEISESKNTEFETRNESVMNDKVEMQEASLPTVN